MHIPNKIIKSIDRLIGPIVKSLWKVGIKPSHLTLASFLMSLFAAISFYFRQWLIGFILLALSMLGDAFDGPLVRRHKLASKKGELEDTISDRASEFFLFMALGLNGSVNMSLAILSFYAIILNTMLRKRANLDLGFKRIVLFLGIFSDFNTAFSIIFIINIISFMLQLIILDYRNDKILQ